MKLPFLRSIAAASAVISSTLTSFPPLSTATFQQFNTVSDIPIEMFQNHETIYGRVTKVADGDTIRIRHMPMYPLEQSSKFEGKLSDNTISIRMYGIDAPELKKTTEIPSMPCAEDARDWTKNKVDGTIVGVQLFQKDQYNRVVGRVVTTNEIIPTDLSLSLAHNGFATLYEGKGAEYAGNKALLENELNYAKSSRLCVWKDGEAMSPALYKKMVKEIKQSAKTK